MKSLKLVCIVSTIGLSNIFSVKSENLIKELFSNVKNDLVSGDDLQTQSSDVYDAMEREGKRRKYPSRKQDRSDYGYEDDHYGYDDDHYGHYDHYHYGSYRGSGYNNDNDDDDNDNDGENPTGLQMVIGIC